MQSQPQTPAAQRITLPATATKAQLTKAASANPHATVVRATTAKVLDAMAAKNKARASAPPRASLGRPTAAQAKPPLQKGNGALVGVAHGATHNQPHTKLAVEQARKAASQVAKPPVAPKAPAPVQAKPAKAPTDADRTYKAGPNAYTPKPGSWTAYMVAVILDHGNTAAARAAHAKSHAKAGQPHKPLDFSWCAAKGYIVFKA